eukprot:Hpha_TRINITY_DN24852_c0_g1::TRINITY_DN24852_c0_g1_i1::g.97354::m.97354
MGEPVGDGEPEELSVTPVVGNPRKRRRLDGILRWWRVQRGGDSEIARHFLDEETDGNLPMRQRRLAENGEHVIDPDNPGHFYFPERYGKKQDAMWSVPEPIGVLDNYRLFRFSLLKAENHAIEMDNLDKGLPPGAAYDGHAYDRMVDIQEPEYRSRVRIDLRTWDSYLEVPPAGGVEFMRMDSQLRGAKAAAAFNLAALADVRVRLQELREAERHALRALATLRSFPRSDGTAAVGVTNACLIRNHRTFESWTPCTLTEDMGDDKFGVEVDGQDCG